MLHAEKRRELVCRFGHRDGNRFCREVTPNLVSTEARRVVFVRDAPSKLFGDRSQRAFKHRLWPCHEYIVNDRPRQHTAALMRVRPMSARQGEVLHRAARQQKACRLGRRKSPQQSGRAPRRSRH